MAVSLVYLSIASNVAAVLIVVMCLLGMMLYIYRLRGDLNFSSSVVMVNQPRIQQDMIRVEVPFALELINTNTNVCHAQYHVSNKCPCLLQVFWGMDIAEVHSVFSWPWMLLRQYFLDSDSDVLTNFYLVKESLKILEDSSEFDFTLRHPESFSFDKLGPMPRTKYPIAIFAVRSDNNNVSSTSVVSMLTVIHLEDSVCTIKTCILLQYLKQANGFVSSLKPLYFSSSEESYETLNEPQSTSTCIVCQLKPVSMVLLPCRHTCICGECFTKLDKCPLCRSTISSYFSLQNSYS